jgi:hypothetical protein
MLKDYEYIASRYIFSESVAMLKLGLAAECSPVSSDVLKRMRQEEWDTQKTWTPGEGKCKALETEGDISYPSDHLTTMLEPYSTTKKLIFPSSYISIPTISM